MRHFVTLIEICMHLIRVNPGHRQIQSAVLSLNTRALSFNTRGPEARDITDLRQQAEVDRALLRMLSSANLALQFTPYNNNYLLTESGVFIG